MVEFTLPIRLSDQPDDAEITALKFIEDHPASTDGILIHSDTIFKIHNISIWRSILMSLQSLEQGGDAPNHISLAQIPEINTILTRYDQVFFQEKAETEWTNTDLRTSLCGHAIDALIDGEENEPSKSFRNPFEGFLEFLEIWFVRTVNFVTQRKCSLHEHRLAGIHDHDGELYYHPGLWTPELPEDEDNWRFFDQFSIEEYPDHPIMSNDDEPIPSYMQFDEAETVEEVSEELLALQLSEPGLEHSVGTT